VTHDKRNSEPAPRRRFFFAAGAGGLLLLAAALRIGGAFNDLWLDEIWSVRLAGTLSSFGQIFTGLHQDNNHYLNTAWLYLCGQRGNWWGYRVPALAAGVGTVCLAGVLGRPRGRPCALLAMAVTGFSHVLVLYSSEARGYAPMLFFAFLCFFLLDTFLRRLEWRWAGLFSLGAILGFCSHLSFILFFLAAMFWSACRLVLARVGPGRAAGALLACHALPAAFVAWLYWVDIRSVAATGGSATGGWTGLETILAWAVGRPPGAAALLAAALAVAAALAGALWRLWRERSDQLLFFGVMTVLVPAGLVLVLPPVAFYVRFFIISLAFFLLLASYALAWLYDRGPGGRAACFILLGLFILCNGLQTAEFLRLGRGHYAEAVRFMAAHTPGAGARVGGDHDFRIPLILDFYREAAAPKILCYLPQSESPPGGVDWLICHREAGEPPVPPSPQLCDPEGHRYDWVKTYPAAPLSGLHWFLYRNAAAAR